MINWDVAMTLFSREECRLTILRGLGFYFMRKYDVDSIKPRGNKLSFSFLSNRWALWSKCIIWQVYTRGVQERWRLCESSRRWIHVWVSTRWVREALLRDDNAQFPRTVLCHLQRPEAAVPLHRILHVSTFSPEFLQSNPIKYSFPLRAQAIQQ